MHLRDNIYIMPIGRWPDLDPGRVAAEALAASPKRNRVGEKRVRAEALGKVQERLKRAGVRGVWYRETVEYWLNDLHRACCDLRRESRRR